MKTYKAIERDIQAALAKIRNGKGSLYDIANWCIELFNAQNDYAEQAGVTVEELPDYITNTFLRDFAIDLQDLLVLMKHLPDRDQWNKPLVDLLGEVKAKIKGEWRKDREQASVPRVTKKEFAEVSERAVEAEKRVARVESELDRLKAENADLRRENAVLQGRIEELERIAGRKTVNV